jgi:hypothetical protein
MELNAETWFAVTAEASKRVLLAFKSKEFLTPFDINMPFTPENLAIATEHIKAISQREEAARIVCDFLLNLVVEAPVVIKEMERKQNEQGQ